MLYPTTEPTYRHQHQPSPIGFFEKRNNSQNFIFQEKKFSLINGNHNRSSENMQMNFNNDLYMNQQLPNFNRQ